MNTIFISPHFPPNFTNFCVQLRQAGANVLGLADQPFESLNHELRNAFTEYYRVSDLHNYDELVRALGYLTHRHGKIDHLDSHNEYWLETEAALRTDFNIRGINLSQINTIKRKSEMKRVFLEAGLKPARGRICKTAQEIGAFVKEVGYAVVAKPDIGVGAAKTYKINNDTELSFYLQDKLQVDYIVEEFIDEQIVSYDGLVDADGELVFSSSLRYSKGVMEAVNENTDLYYYLVRDIEPALENAGKAALKAFDVRERFFHFEFFMTKSGDVMPMEVNMRPPGGLTLDMFNFLWDFDCYRIWAEMIVRGSAPKVTKRPRFVMYVGRKDHIPYAISHDQVLNDFQSLMIYQERISGVFAGAIGNHGYVLRNPELEPLVEAAHAIQKRR